jgi:hypothetical protein
MSLLQIPPFVANRLSGYIPSSDHNLRMTSRQFYDSIDEPSSDDYLNELLYQFKNDCNRILIWMKTSIKEDKGKFILTFADTSGSSFPLEFRDIIKLCLKNIGHTYGYRINFMQDMISIVNQIPSWKDIENVSADFGLAINRCFFNIYVLSSNYKVIKTWLVSPHEIKYDVSESWIRSSHEVKYGGTHEESLLIDVIGYLHDYRDRIDKILSQIDTIPELGVLMYNIFGTTKTRNEFGKYIDRKIAERRVLLEQ